MGQAREELVAPLDFKHLTLTKNRPGEDDETNYYAQKRRRQYHGNESADVKELSMKPDKKLPNLRVPVKGKKGVSKFMRKKAAATAKDDINAQKNPKIDEALKPISTLDQVKAAIKIARDKRFNMKSQIDKKTAIEKISKDLLKDPKVKKELDKIYEAINHDDAHRDAQTHSNGSMSVKKIPSMIKKPGDKHLHLHMKSYHKEKDGQDFAKKHGYKVKNYVKTQSGTRMDLHKEDAKKFATADKMNYKKTNMKNMPKDKDEVDEAIKHTHAVVDPAGKVAGMSSNERDAKDIARRHKGKVIKLKRPISTKKGEMMINRPFKEEAEVDEALTLQQRMKRSRMMRRMRTRIKVGRERAKRKMANKEKLEKRARRQARNMIAKKLTRGIPKAELTFARKKEIEKRLEKPVLQARIKRIAKRIFKDVRKKEVQRKKG